MCVDRHSADLIASKHSKLVDPGLDLLSPDFSKTDPFKGPLSPDNQNNQDNHQTDESAVNHQLIGDIVEECAENVRELGDIKKVVSISPAVPINSENTVTVVSLEDSTDTIEKTKTIDQKLTQNESNMTQTQSTETTVHTISLIDPTEGHSNPNHINHNSRSSQKPIPPPKSSTPIPVKVTKPANESGGQGKRSQETKRKSDENPRLTLATQEAVKWAKKARVNESHDTISKHIPLKPGDENWERTLTPRPPRQESDTPSDRSVQSEPISFVYHPLDSTSSGNNQNDLN